MCFIFVNILKVSNKTFIYLEAHSFDLKNECAKCCIDFNRQIKLLSENKTVLYNIPKNNTFV